MALTLGWRCLPHTTPASHGFDWQSAALSAVTFGLGIAAIDSLGHGEALSICLSEFCVAAVAGLLLVFRQTHTASPLLPVDLLRIPIFALSIATSIASFCAQMLAFVAMPFYLESRFGYSAVQIGLLISPGQSPSPSRRRLPVDWSSAIRPDFWAASGSCCSPWALAHWRYCRLTPQFQT